MRGARKPFLRTNRRRASLAFQRHGVVLVLAAVLGAGLGLSAPRLLARLAPEHAVLQAVSVRGCKHVPPPELVARAGLAAGMPLASIDLVALQRALVGHPWVRKARATTLPLGRVLIDVEEREPVALVRDATGARHYVDETGEVFADAPGSSALPELRGLEAGEPPTALAPRLVQGVQLLEGFASHGIRPAPSEIWLGGDAPERLPAVSWGDEARGGLRAVIGGGALDAKLGYLAELLQAGLPEVTQASEIDLRFGERVILRGVPVGPAAAGNEEEGAPASGDHRKQRGG